MSSASIAFTFNAFITTTVLRTFCFGRLAIESLRFLLAWGGLLLLELSASPVALLVRLFLVRQLNSRFGVAYPCLAESVGPLIYLTSRVDSIFSYFCMH